jgi:hypothetical protein
MLRGSPGRSASLPEQGRAAKSSATQATSLRLRFKIWARYPLPQTRRDFMSKGLDKKKEDKKKPEKTLKEKRAEKAAKKGK